MAKKVISVGTERFLSTLDVTNATGAEVLAVDRFDHAGEQLLLREQPMCVVFDATSVDARTFCTKVRHCASLADLQVIAIVDDPWSAQVAQAFSAGADDFVPAGLVWQLGEKTTALADEHAAVGSAGSGRIVLADGSRERRVVVGRHLRRTGLDILFAVDGSFLLDRAVRLVVADTELGPGGAASCIRSLRSKHGNAVPWVVTGANGSLGQVREQLAGEPNVAFLDITADASPIVFVANGLVTDGVAYARRTERYPYATPVRWECEGDVEGDRWGYTYNINRGGIYVRTFNPPRPGSKICLEFSPPCGRGRVVVEGTAVWRQGFSRGRGLPTGFGVKYAEGMAVADAAALDAGYTWLDEQLGQCQLSPEQPEASPASARLP